MVLGEKAVLIPKPCKNFYSYFGAIIDREEALIYSDI